jgi:hypothetical protein
MTVHRADGSTEKFFGTTVKKSERRWDTIFDEPIHFEGGDTGELTMWLS